VIHKKRETMFIQLLLCFIAFCDVENTRNIKNLLDIICDLKFSINSNYELKTLIYVKCEMKSIL